MSETPLITTIAVGFAAAWVLGLFTQWLRLSPIVGYILAGLLVGPYTPGLRADPNLAHELAEVGVILLMFGVGLHFNLGELLAVRRTAIPGALLESSATTLLTMAILWGLGFPPGEALAMGLALAVASTVLLMRVLSDADALQTTAGVIAVGWLVVEDLLTVIVLVLLPVFGSMDREGPAMDTVSATASALASAILRLAALVGVVYLAGSRFIPWVLMRVARLRSRELFTLTVLVFSVAVAAGTYAAFGASMALGAFLAGMVVGQSPVSHQAAADALPLRDAFAVLFFVSVGMLFNPSILINQPFTLLAMVAVIILAKPLIAFCLVVLFGQTVPTALTVGLGLGQIGEFSFILAESSRSYGLISEESGSLVVAAAIVAITINPFLFNGRHKCEAWLKRSPVLWGLLNARAERLVAEVNAIAATEMSTGSSGDKGNAIVVGYGPVGREVEKLLRGAGLNTLVIDMNMDTVLSITANGGRAVFGDAANQTILELAGVREASHLILTLPQHSNRAAIVAMARDLNADMRVFVRARYLREQGELEQVGATACIFEEAEAAVALARMVLADTGAGGEAINRAVRDIRMRLMLESMSSLRSQRVRQIMVPWSSVRILATSFPIDRVRRLVAEQHYSRWPVVDSETSEPIGYLLVKDLVGHDSDGDWTRLVRPLGFMPSDNDIESALNHFQRESATICLVRDADRILGLLTLEDILEQVVGRIEDEYPHAPQLTLSSVLVTTEPLLDIQAVRPEEAIRLLARSIPPDRVPVEIDIGGLAVAREKEATTDIGLGVAIPHARCPNLQSPVVVFGRAVTGIPFQKGVGCEPVRLLFLLVTPMERAEAQVLLLGQLALFAGNADTRKKLLEARDVGEVLGLFEGFSHG